MDYIEARAYLEQVSRYGSELGLDNIRELLGRLGNPQDDLRFIHISGTNGKGSVLAYLSTILSGAGYRTGRYLSPTLFSYREKIQVDGEPISRESLAAHVTAIAAASRDMEEKRVGTPTIFEVETVLAFLYFKEKNCDIVVLETGMGGALDATNIVRTSILEVIASISMDHMEFLGDTLAKIAVQKAGIIKPDTRVVSAKQEESAEEVLRRVCRERGCPLGIVAPEKITEVEYGYERQSFSYVSGSRVYSPEQADVWNHVEIALAGSYQIINAALALEAVSALRKLGYSISDEQVYRGFWETRWKGRFTLIGRHPEVIMDGAHNPAAATVLRQSLELYFPGRKLYYVFGVFRDKDYKEIIRLTASLAAHIITVQTPDNPRALPAEELKLAVEAVNPHVEAAGSVREGVERALGMAAPEDAVIIFGSLSFLGEAERAVTEYGKG